MKPGMSRGAATNPRVTSARPSTLIRDIANVIHLKWRYLISQENRPKTGILRYKLVHHGKYRR